jgi:hypothetical protein
MVYTEKGGRESAKASRVGKTEWKEKKKTRQGNRKETGKGYEAEKKSHVTHVVTTNHSNSQPAS